VNAEIVFCKCCILLAHFSSLFAVVLNVAPRGGRGVY
jgi:hypothetical protein